MGAIKSPRCSLGHKMKDPNLYYRSDGKRECLTCKDRRNRESNAARKAARVPKPRKPRGKAKSPTLKQRIIAKGAAE
jgi:hypothetical protein